MLYKTYFTYILDINNSSIYSTYSIIVNEVEDEKW